MARAEIRRNPDTLEGDGLAIGRPGARLGAWSRSRCWLICWLILFFGGLAVFLGWLGIAGHLN